MRPELVSRQRLSQTLVKASPRFAPENSAQRKNVIENEQN